MEQQQRENLTNPCRCLSKALNDSGHVEMTKQVTKIVLESQFHLVSPCPPLMFDCIINRNTSEMTQSRPCIGTTVTHSRCANGSLGVALWQAHACNSLSSEWRCPSADSSHFTAVRTASQEGSFCGHGSHTLLLSPNLTALG